MIILMKLVSFSIDFRQNNSQLNIFEFFSYHLSFEGIVFGPWISYENFLSSMDLRTTGLVRFKKELRLPYYPCNIESSH